MAQAVSGVLEEPIDNVADLAGGGVALAVFAVGGPAGLEDAGGVVGALARGDARDEDAQAVGGVLVIRGGQVAPDAHQVARPAVRAVGH